MIGHAQSDTKITLGEKMALITCDECGKEFSDKAKTCIHCGAPVVTESSWKYFDNNGNPRQPFGWEVKKNGPPSEPMPSQSTHAQTSLNKVSTSSTNTNSPKPKRKGKIILIGLGILVGLGILGSFIPDDGTSTTRTVESSRQTGQERLFANLSCSALIAEVGQNEASFVRKYKGKTIRVTGTVDSVNSSFGGTQINLSDGEEYSFNSCSVYPNKKDEWPFNLKKGSLISVTCSDIQEVIGSVNLKRCVLS